MRRQTKDRGNRTERGKDGTTPAVREFQPKTRPGHRAKAVVVEGVLYPRVLDAEREKGVVINTIIRWLRDPRRPDCYYVDESPK